MTATNIQWTEGAIARVRSAVGSAPQWPWDRGLWVTGRERYDPVPIPDGFVIQERRLAGARRRLASTPGRGRALLILPGLYAALDERLFVAIATCAAATGRPVMLLEDRLAAPTVQLAGAQGLDLERAGRAVTELVEGLPERPDVLALSAGLLGAWSADPDSLHRVVGFSGIRDPAATARAVRRRGLVRRHFAACHARSGLGVPFEALLDRWEGLGPLDPPHAPWLLVHADDDPVVPISSLDDLDPAHIYRLPTGGHLGFGVRQGPATYLAPFEEPDDG